VQVQREPPHPRGVRAFEDDGLFDPGAGGFQHQVRPCIHLVEHHRVVVGDGRVGGLGVGHVEADGGSVTQVDGHQRIRPDRGGGLRDGDLHRCRHRHQPGARVSE